MGSLIPKLHELLKVEYNLRKGVKDKIRSLIGELEVAQAVLRKVAEVPRDQLGEQDRLWVLKVTESSYDMEDVVDTFLVRVQGPDSAGKEESLLKHLKKMANFSDKTKCKADDDNDVGEDKIELGSKQTEEGEMGSTLNIIEFATSSSLGNMGLLLRKLDLLLDSENQLIQRSTKEAIKLLKEDLEEIIDDLVELSMVERPNYKVRYWMYEVREVSYHIEDCIDNMMQLRTVAKAKMRFSVRHLQLRVHRRVKIPWLPKTVQPSARIAELRALLWEARERHERYQLQDCVSSEPRWLFPWNSRPPVLPPVSSGARANLVGVDITRGKLTTWFINQMEAKQLKVLFILGPPGVGKTALAKELYRQVEHQFECRAFIRVSRNPDMRRLLGEILAQVQGCKRDYENEAASTADNLMDSIRFHLRDKRYFVVIDELWDAAAWDIMNIAFPKDNNCSRIIITAEGKDVASKCYCVNKLDMAPLGNLQDCGKIFFDRVFGSEHQCPNQLKDISCMIIRNCGGFPLAITTIAGLLASHQIDNTELWHHIQQCFSSRLTGLTLEETCKEVVNICYDALPQDLKTCLLYLTIFPEGYTVRKVDLLNQWIAEGFISPMEAKQAVAEIYFAELINRGMIQPEKVDHNDEVLSCTVHHIVFDLIAQKSREENFITAVDYSQAMPGFSMIARRLSLHFSCAQFAAKPEGLKLSQLRSLAFYGLIKCMPSITEFKFLRVLILEFWGDNYHHNTSLDLSKLSILFHLRYLKVSSHTIIVLPSQIRRLQSLETLEIDAKVSTVPTDILHLPVLLHLSLPNGTELPDRIGRITSLRTLEYFDLGSNSEDNAQSLGELIKLQNLHVTCFKAVSDHHLKRNLVALYSSIGKLPNLKSLRVGPFAAGMTMFIDQDRMPCTPKLLQRLELLPPSCIFSRLPTWIGGLQRLRILKIVVKVLLSSDIDTLTGLPFLAVLSLYVQKPNAKSVVFNSGSLPALKYFKYRCAALRLAFQKEALPNLQRLKLCFNVHRAESYTSNLAGIENLLKLKEITAEIGAAAGAGESDRRAAESALKEVTRKHPRFPIHINVKSVDCIEEGSMQVRFMHFIPFPYIGGFLALAVSVLTRKYAHVLVKSFSTLPFNFNQTFSG